MIDNMETMTIFLTNLLKEHEVCRIKVVVDNARILCGSTLVKKTSNDSAVQPVLQEENDVAGWHLARRWSDSTLNDADLGPTLPTRRLDQSPSIVNRKHQQQIGDNVGIDSVDANLPIGTECSTKGKVEGSCPQMEHLMPPRTSHTLYILQDEVSTRRRRYH